MKRRSFLAGLGALIGVGVLPKVVKPAEVTYEGKVLHVEPTRPIQWSEQADPSCWDRALSPYQVEIDTWGLPPGHYTFAMQGEDGEFVGFQDFEIVG